jgi:hypothetical protein
MLKVANAENQWITTLTPSMPELLQQAQRILDGTIFCSVATCSVAVVPWVSPVFFAFDRQLNLYWSSAVAARHT